MTALTRLPERYPLLFAIYVPVLIFSVSMALLVALMPLYVADFDVSYTVIGVVVAASGIGTMLGDVPAGVLLRRYSIKTGMIGGLVLWGAAMASLFWAGTIWIVVAAQLLGGVGRALFIVSWHAYIADAIDVERRGRSLSRMGGIFRVSNTIGPLLGAEIADVFRLEAPFLVTGLLCVLALGFVLAFTRPDRSSAPHGSAGLAHLGSGLLAIFRDHRAILLAAGSGQMLTAIVRNGRNTILPLYGADVLGLGVDQIGLIMSLAWGVDLLLFPAAGWLMDRRGRKYAIVPSFVIQGVGMALIPLAGGFGGLAAVGMLLGLGNGISAGTMLTLSADLAPDEGRGDFLGLWHLIGDLGFAGGPFVVGAVADILALSTAALALAGAGFGAALVFGRFVPETLKPREAVRVAGRG